MINVYKSPISKEKYGNLFLDKIPEGVKNVCLLFIGHSETVHYIMSQKPEIDFTVIDGSDVTEALPYIYTADNLKSTISFEESDCEEDTFLEKLKVSFEDYNINDMSFDLIIANPPYGDDNKGTFPRKIIEVARKCTKESIWLLPTTYFQYGNLFKEIADFKRFPKAESQNLFNGAACPPLSVVRFDGKIHSLFSDKFDYSLPRTPLVNAFRQYNNSHPGCCEPRSGILRHNNLGTKDGKSPSAFDPETFKLYNQDFYERTLVFGMYWISNGIHKDEGNAIDNFWNYKLKDYKDFQAKVKELDAHPDLHAATFKSKQEKQNCEKYRHGKLYSKLLSEFDNGGSIEYIRLCIPNLDWSHPWTDQEILKELGLPEDFLEKE